MCVFFSIFYAAFLIALLTGEKIQNSGSGFCYILSLLTTNILLHPVNFKSHIFEIFPNDLVFNNYKIFLFPQPSITGTVGIEIQTCPNFKWSKRDLNGPELE